MGTFITLADTKAQLNIPSTDSSQDAELQDFIDAACDEVEQWVGPVAPSQVVNQRVVLPGRSIAPGMPTNGVLQFPLRSYPVISLDAISTTVPALYDLPYVTTDFAVDQATGVVYRTDGGVIYGPLTVSYTVGRAAVPAWARLAAKIIAQHLWRTQRAAAAPAASVNGVDGALVPGFGFAIPAAAAELLESHRRSPAVA